MRALHAIAYVSSAARELSDAELAAMRSESLGHNLAAGITGVLLYCEGNFMQYIEGPQEAVRALFARVHASALHHQVRELMNGPIAQREFADWRVGFSRTAGTSISDMNSTWGSCGESAGPGAQMLKMFARNCRARMD